MRFLKKTLASSKGNETASPSERAKESGLITFNHELTGTRCSNCMFVTRRDGVDACGNPKLLVKLPDGADYMCCNLWREDDMKETYTDKELS